MKDQRSGALLVASAALLWSSGGLFIKMAPMPGLAVAFGRSLIGALFYWVVLRPAWSRAKWATAAAYAACVVSFVAATKLTTAANAIFLQYAAPAYVLALSPWLLRERFRRVDAVCVALSLVGMSLLFIGRFEPGAALGNVLGVVSGVFFALTIVLLRRDARGGQDDAIPSVALGNFLAAAATLPFAARQIPFTLPAAGVLLYLGIVQLGIAYLLFARGVKKVPAAEASLISMLEAVFNPIWVFLGTGERPSLGALAGGAVVIAAVTARAVLVRD